MRGEVGSETQGGPLALRHHRSADHLLCIIRMVAWLSNNQCQEEAKQSTKTGMLGDNGSASYDTCWCCGYTRWPPSAGNSDTGGGEFSGTSSLEFVVLV